MSWRPKRGHIAYFLSSPENFIQKLSLKSGKMRGNHNSKFAQQKVDFNVKDFIATIVLFFKSEMHF
jgi:hypothetical protein